MTRYSRDRREYLPLENRMLEVLLALAFFFAGKDMGFGVCYGQGGLVRHSVQGMKAFEDFYREVDGVVFSGCHSRGLCHCLRGRRQGFRFPYAEETGRQPG